VANNTVSRWELGQRSIPEFLPLALETIERRLSKVKDESTVGSNPKSTVGSFAINASDNETLLSTVQVAERLNLSRKSVNDYILSGKLRAVKGKQNHNFILESDLLAFMAKK
jgi:hypothetical protein